MGSSSNFEWQILAFQDRTIWSGLKLFCQELNNLNKAGEFKESFSEPNKKKVEKEMLRSTFVLILTSRRQAE